MADDETIPVSSGKGSKAPVSTKTNFRNGIIISSESYTEPKRESIQKSKKPQTDKKPKKDG